MCFRRQLEGNLNTVYASFFRIKSLSPSRLRAISWVKPPNGQLKIITDASVVKGKATERGVLRDHEGLVVGTFYKEFGECDIPLAKGYALMHGLRWCLENNYSDIRAEVDSQILVQLVNSGVVVRWPLCSFLSQIQLLLNRLGDLSRISIEKQT